MEDSKVYYDSYDFDNKVFCDESEKYTEVDDPCIWYN